MAGNAIVVVILPDVSENAVVTKTSYLYCLRATSLLALGYLVLPSLNKGIIIIIIIIIITIIIIINIIMLEDLSFCYREGGLISFNKNNHVNFSDDKKLK